MDDVPTPVPSEEPTLGPEATVVDVGRRRGRLLWSATFVAVVALIGGVVVLAGQDDDVDPDAALAAAQEAVEGAESYRYDLKQTTHLTSGDPDGAGSETTTRSVTHGEIADAQHWRVAGEDSMGVYFDEEVTPWEARRVGDHLYSSGGIPASEQGVGPAWSVADALDAEPRDDAEAHAEMFEFMFEGMEPADIDPESLLQMSLLGYLPDITGDPVNIERVVRDATDPEVEESLADGGVRLRTTLPPVEEMAKAAAEHDVSLPPIDVVLDLREDRLPTALRFDVSVEGASNTVEATFRDWGGPISVEPPEEADIDHTPWIEEELIGQVDPSAVRAPTTLPADLELVSAYTYEGYDEDGDVDPSCRELNLTYGSKAEADRVAELGDDIDYDDPSVEDFFEQLPQLALTLAPARCEVDVPEEDDPFDENIGGLAARNIEDLEEYGYFEVKVDDLIVDVGAANLSTEQLVSVLRALQRTSVEELASRIPAWARDQAQWMSGPSPMGSGGYVEHSAAIRFG